MASFFSAFCSLRLEGAVVGDRGEVVVGECGFVAVVVGAGGEFVGRDLRVVTIFGRVGW